MEVFEAPLRIRRRRSPGGGLEEGEGGLEGGGGGLQVEVPTVRWWLLEGGHSHMHTNANR